MDILNDMDRKCDEVTCHLDGVCADLEELADPELGIEPDHDDHPVPSGEIAHEEPENHSDVAAFGDDFDMDIEL